MPDLTADRSIARRVAERYLGRKLKSEEEVHHINFDPTDNRIVNLIVFKNREAHMICHGNGNVTRRGRGNNGNFRKEICRFREKDLRARQIFAEDIALYGPKAARNIEKHLKRVAQKTKTDFGLI